MREDMPSKSSITSPFLRSLISSFSATLAVPLLKAGEVVAWAAPVGIRAAQPPRPQEMPLLFWAMPAATLFSALTLTSVPLLPATPAMVFAAYGNGAGRGFVATGGGNRDDAGLERRSATPSLTVAIDESLEVQLTVASFCICSVVTVAEQASAEASPTGKKERFVLLSSTFWAGLVNGSPKRSGRATPR